MIWAVIGKEFSSQEGYSQHAASQQHSARSDRERYPRLERDHPFSDLYKSSIICESIQDEESAIIQKVGSSEA